MRIAYLPIDERPCNVTMVKQIADSKKDIELMMPNSTWLGQKKIPADIEKLWAWLMNKASDVDAIIVSIDLMLYGGLLPSRTHYLTYEEGLKRLEQLRELRECYPELPIYASNVIMRTPRYNSSDEEPDYYEEWGRDLFLRSYLKDKQLRANISNSELSNLQEIESRLPTGYIEDYEIRRKFNLQMNNQVLNLVKEGVVSFLSIPQDDSSEYGYTSIDQKEVVHKRNVMELHDSVQIYPGADEVGSTLLTRAYNEFTNSCPTIYPLWSSTLGHQLIPLYEDRPFGESLKAHILAAGCQLADSPDKANLILAYNTPGQVMQESWEQNTKDITYNSFRNIQFFVEQINSFVSSGKKVIIADTAFANGGDYELIKRLDNKCILDKLTSYKGWNTNCNTLGSTICQGVIGLSGDTEIIKRNLCYHLLDDYFYQADVRNEMTNNFLPDYDLTYFDLGDKAELVNQERDKRLLNNFNKVIRNSFNKNRLQSIHTFAPWNRMFECGFELEFER